MSARRRGLRRIAIRMALLGSVLAIPLAGYAADGTIYFRGMIVEPPYNVRILAVPTAGTTLEPHFRNSADIRFDTDSRDRPNVRVRVDVMNRSTANAPAVNVQYAGKPVDMSRPLALIGAQTAHENATLTVATVKGPADAVVTVSYD